MARVTVEDCVTRIPNRFELTLLSAHRARTLTRRGTMPSVPRDRDKDPVVALREIAAGTVDKEDLKEDLIQSMQDLTEVDDPSLDPASPSSRSVDDSSVSSDGLSRSPLLSDLPMTTMSESDLLRSLEKMEPPTLSGSGRSGS